MQGKRYGKPCASKRKRTVHVRYSITGGCDTDKNVIVAAIYHAESGDLETREFRQPEAEQSELLTARIDPNSNLERR